MASAGNGRKILIIVENLPVPFDRRVWQEATTLSEAGYVVSVICPKGKGYAQAYERLDNIHIYRHWLPAEADGALGYLLEYSSALLLEFWLSLKVWRNHGIDLVHACNPPDTIFIIGTFYKLFGKRFIFDHHDINPELYEAKFGKRGFFHRLLLMFERWSFRAADVCIATNESYKAIAIERGGVDPDRVHVVRSGPDLRRLRILPAEPKHKNGRKFLVGYVGVMGKQEGLDLLLEAATHIVKQLDRQDIHFCLIGGGTELDNLRSLALELGIDDYVTFTGRVSDQDLLSVLNTSDVCVNPDVANEMNDKSTMNKIMEYMALGKPIVQFDLTEGRFSAQNASLYANRNDPVDLATKIVSLLEDPVRRQAMGELGIARVREVLAWDFEKPRLLRAYADAFGV